MQTELLATHFGLVQLALASSLKLPFMGRRKASNTLLHRISCALLLLACLCLTFSFLVKWRGSEGLDSSGWELAFVLVIGWLGAIGLFLWRSPTFQVMVAPVMTLALAVHLVLEWTRAQGHSSFESSFLACHIAGAIAGEILAVLAAAIAVLYLGQHRFLKEKRFAHLMRKIPALDLLDECLIAALSAGFLFLSIALASGSIFLFHSGAEQFKHLTVKLIWALTVWLWYFSALFSRMALHFSTKNLARMSVLGFCMLVGAYFGFIF